MLSRFATVSQSVSRLWCHRQSDAVCSGCLQSSLLSVQCTA